MAKHEYQQQRGTVALAGENGSFQGSVRLDTPSTDTVVVTHTDVVETGSASADEAEARALLDAGVLPVGTPIPSGLAAEVALEGDDEEGLFVVYEGVSGVSRIEGARGDVRRDVIGEKDCLITFLDETASRFERDDYTSLERVIIQSRGAVVHVDGEVDGIDQVLHYMEFEKDFDADYARAFETLAGLYHDEVGAEEDVMQALGHLVYLKGEVDDGADVGDWSTPQGRHALVQGMNALVNALPVSVIRRFAYEEYGRSYSDTDAMLGTPGENPLL